MWTSLSSTGKARSSPVPNELARILILGGTAEARMLAERLEGKPRFSPLTSLAGVTLKPSRIAGEVRTGGFGGPTGLANFLREESIALMVDATHPFAAQISANAVQASARSGIPCLRLERSEWEEQKGDDWMRVNDIKAAARAIPSNARALVTVGRQEVEPFFAREDIHVLARMIEPPDTKVPDSAEIILARPSFSLDEERALLEEKHVSVLVSKNSGGAATYAKIEAAREMELPVIMIARPGKPEAVTASSVEEMMALIEKTLD
jgi:precorrin-6A/cobalt-precorrin-6A reductase